MRKAITILAMVCISLSTVSVHAAQSTFDTDAEGWSMMSLRTFGNPPTGFPGSAFWWESNTGNPGGCIKLKEYAGPNDTFKAPEEYLGDKSSAFGTNLTFDLWTSIGGEHVSVALVGSSTTLYYWLTPEGGSWNQFQIPLVGSGWKKNSHLGPDATDDDMSNVLGNVTALYIWGDFTGSGSEYSRLDNVFMAEAPVEIWVEIDIKPGSYPNSINPNAGGVIPVAILTTADFDASTVDPQTVALEGAAARCKGKSGRYGSMEDVDGDGDLDLVVQIENDIEWDPEATEATLTGQLNDGTPIEGSDCIRLVPDNDKKGDQMWLSDRDFVPHAQMQVDIDDTVAFYTGFDVSLWDDSLYAYNQGARSAIITGPGLPVAGQVLEHYYPEPVFRLYPKGAGGHPGGGWGLWLDDTVISAIPDNAEYTIGIYQETADTVSLSNTPLKTYTKTIVKRPVLNTELNTLLFPALITPSSHDESDLDIPGLVEVSWSNPSNMSVEYINLGLHSPGLNTEYLISTDVTPGDTSATLDTTSLPLDVRAGHLFLQGDDADERKFGFGWDLSSQ